MAVDIAAYVAARIIHAEGCWEWSGSHDRWGYGLLPHNRARAVGTRVAHRAVYILLVGAVPSGLQLDHLCRNPRCVNPGHLEPVTARVNSLRSTSFCAVNYRKTHCPRGHEYNEANTYRHSQPGRTSRNCRPCNAIAVAKYKKRKQETAS